MKTLLAIAGGLSIVTVVAMPHQPLQAQTFPPAAPNCVYLREVTTRQTVIRKVIATNNSNANTDFAVPTGVAFRSYVGKFMPENNARYTTEVNLKYSDNSTSTVSTRTIEARRFYIYQLPFQTPTAKQPFQINARVTGDRNTAYRIAIQACR